MTSSPDSLAIPPSERLGLSVRHLLVTVGKAASKARESAASDAEANAEASARGKKILNNVSFDLQPGKLMAIMGGSGSGKTTLLNVLSQRTNVLNKKLQFEGAVRFVRSDGDSDSVTAVRHAYMLQTSLFLPGLTVYETLKYAADLRLPPSVPAEEKTALLAFLLDQLNLAKIAQCTICSFKNPEKSSLSGGEQRRVSLAIQLLTRPAILFLDEPTTGLDSALALSLVHTLSGLTKLGMTVVLSIHQPRMEILDAIDEFCLLSSGGRLIYHGNVAASHAYFGSIGIEIPADGNVLDFLMDLSVKDSATPEEEAVSVARIDRLVALWTSESVKRMVYDSPYNGDETDSFTRNLRLFHHDKNLSLYQEIVVLTKRGLLLTYRDRFSLVALNGGALLLTFALGWMFYRPTQDLAGIRTMTSCLYAIMEVVCFCPLFFELSRLWTMDGLVYFREKNENLVSVTGFLVSRRLSKFLMEDLAMSIIFSVGLYFMFGLRTDGAAPFFIYFSVCFLTELFSMVLAMFGFAVALDFAISGFYLNMVYQMQNCACGYFVNAATMPVYVRWIKYITFFWYGFGALAANQFTNWSGDCGAETCPLDYTGNYTLATLGYPQGWTTVPIVVLFVWVVAVYLAAGVFLHYRSFDVKMSKNNVSGSRGPEPALPSSEMPVTPEEKGGSAPITIEVRDVSLSVRAKFSKRPPITLLNHINATLVSGKVNAIMGPSGSGKTTLLNLLASRLSTSSVYTSTGDVCLNGEDQLPLAEIGQYASYVLQTDDMLVPFLSVRETLRMQAQLRLSHLTVAECDRQVESLIRRMGLVDCANVMIGSEFVKGISGGEKRRVSIAIQILDNPRILFLDEPTSGLDSKTAASIVLELQELAARGTTVICTIHQPKATMFAQFGNVLLLARGGHVVFNGRPQALVSHLAALLFVPPPFTNVSDFILDVVTRGHSETVEMAQTRIDGLVEHWRHQQAAEKSPCVELTERLSPTDLYAKYGMRKTMAAPFLTTFPLICKRSLIAVWRTPEILISKVFQPILFSIIVALFFAPLRYGPGGISDRLGLIQEGMNFIFLGFLNNVSCYPAERNIFYAEFDDNIYGPFTFILSYTVQEVPYEILGSLVFSALSVFACGFPRTPGMYFVSFYTTFALCNCGELLGIFFNTLFMHQGISLNLLTAILTIGIFMGGTMSLDMPPFFQGWNWINPAKYFTGAMATLGFADTTFRCGEGLSQCLLDNGEAVLSQYGLRANVGGYLGAMTVCLVVYRVFSYMFIVIKMRFFR